MAAAAGSPSITATLITAICDTAELIVSMKMG